MTTTRSALLGIALCLACTGPAAAGTEGGAVTAIDRSAVAVPPATTAPPGIPAITPAPQAAAESTSPLADAIRRVLETDDNPGDGPPLPRSAIETEERIALAAYYAAHAHAPLWVNGNGPTARARALVDEIARGAAYGLDPALIPVPDLDAPRAGDAALARLEIALSTAALAYARHARGGRIPEPAAMLNSNLDRKPQLHEVSEVMTRLASASAENVAGVLEKLHPVHEQFWLIRAAYLKETGGDGKGRLTDKAKRLRANMEFWRWMWDDLGELHIFNNIPEYMQRVVKDGRVIRSERIVVGEIGKQSSVFSRPLKEVVLRPRWRVPESIMVHELWPSLRKGGGLMRSYGLEITTTSGEPRDWRQIDWFRDDIRNYHVWQPPGGRSVLGFVKFSFPSQHTIFMHDTPDKWMFNRGQRTLSHGCLRVKNPMQLAEIVLEHDRGWDRAKIKQLIASGPLDNNVEMTKHIPVHLAYFTAWADDKGGVRFFSDIYGHEKRVRQALDGDWAKIDKGRNHLAKPVPRVSRRAVAQGEGASEFAPSSSMPSARGRRSKKPTSVSDMISEALGF